MKHQLETVFNKIRNPFTLAEAVYLCSDILPDITTNLNIIAICHASDAVVEREFSRMNLIMNDLGSSTNIRKLDATMRIYYNGAEVSDEETDKITDVWKTRGNRRTELWIDMNWNSTRNL